MIEENQEVQQPKVITMPSKLLVALCFACILTGPVAGAFGWIMGNKTMNQTMQLQEQISKLPGTMGATLKAATKVLGDAVEQQAKAEARATQLLEDFGKNELSFKPDVGGKAISVYFKGKLWQRCETKLKSGAIGGCVSFGKTITKIQQVKDCDEAITKARGEGAKAATSKCQKTVKSETDKLNEYWQNRIADGTAWEDPTGQPPAVPEGEEEENSSSEKSE